MAITVIFKSQKIWNSLLDKDTSARFVPISWFDENLLGSFHTSVQMLSFYCIHWMLSFSPFSSLYIVSVSLFQFRQLFGFPNFLANTFHRFFSIISVMKPSLQFL